MLVIEVELLAGRYAATAHDDRRRAEWPPHPARFFSALVAALHDRDPIDASEAAVLRWLEAQPPPALDVSVERAGRIGRRTEHDVFVPVNDVTLIGDPEASVRASRAEVEAAGSDPKRLKVARTALEKAEKRLAGLLAEQKAPAVKPSASDVLAATHLLPASRPRQARTLPVVLPEQPVFRLAWPGEPDRGLRDALDRLCARVARLGHSSSLVRCALTDRPFVPTLVPGPAGEFVLRVVGPGQLDRLEREFQRHRGVENRVLPARPQRYGGPAGAEPARPPRESSFSEDWIVYQRTGGARPLVSRGVDFARALRGALLEQAGGRALSAALSGHRESGAAADEPHVAFVPLPFVGHPHADGSIQGIAVVAPRGLAGNDHKDLLRLLGQWEEERAVGSGEEVELSGPSLPRVRFRRIMLPEKASLRPGTWCRVARRFATATPIALDRNPGNLRSNAGGAASKAAREAEACIADSCERIGLPRPAQVGVSFSPPVTGSFASAAFLPWPGRRGRPARVRVHAEILFDEPVRGPLLLGAGRYFGLGLCLPLDGLEER